MGRKKIDSIFELSKQMPKTTNALDGVLSTVVNVFDIILAPLQIAKIYKDKKLEEIKENIVKKTRDIPEEDLKTQADLSIVGPTFEALKYTILNDDITEMFENLLASSLDSKKEVFPGFVDIVRQLNSDEAKLMKYLAIGGDVFPLISVQCDKNDGRGYSIVLSNFSNIGDVVCEKPDLITSYLFELSRFGLIEFVYDKYIVNSKAYEPLMNHHKVLAIDDKFLLNNGFTNKKINKYIFKITEYGEQFINACVTTD